MQSIAPQTAQVHKNEALSVQAVHLHFDRGFATRPRAFYERLEIREWLSCLDWLFAEAADRLAALEPGESTAEAIERERNLLDLLEAEIREAEQLHLRLSLPPLPEAISR